MDTTNNITLVNVKKAKDRQTKVAPSSAAIIIMSVATSNAITTPVGRPFE